MFKIKNNLLHPFTRKKNQFCKFLFGGLHLHGRKPQTFFLLAKLKKNVLAGQKSTYRGPHFADL